MPLVLVEREKDVGALARRLLPPKTSKAATERVVQAIRVANPGLDLDRLRPGTLVVVPVVPGGRRPAGVADSTADQLLEDMAASLEAVAAAAEAALAVDHSEREQSKTVFLSREVRRAAARDQDLSQLLTDLRESFDQDESAAVEQTQSVRQAIQAWDEDLKALQQLMHPPE